MVPLRDINPVRSTPVVNYLLILTNIAAFIWMSTLPSWYEPGYALVPTRIVADPLGEAFTIFTSMFMHASVMHLGGNMLFLWIFGDNVEDAMGHFRYLCFYLLGGVAAAGVQMAMTIGSPIPMVGASGAIAAVTGAYMLLYPRAPILILNPVPLLWLIWGLTIVVPAWFVAGEFFLLNVATGFQALHGANGSGSGGVAVFAHIGGFVAGLLMVGPLTRGRKRRAHGAWDGWRPPARS